MGCFFVCLDWIRWWDCRTPNRNPRRPEGFVIGHYHFNYGCVVFELDFELGVILHIIIEFPRWGSLAENHSPETHDFRPMTRTKNLSSFISTYIWYLVPHDWWCCSIFKEIGYLTQLKTIYLTCLSVCLPACLSVCQLSVDDTWYWWPGRWAMIVMIKTSIQVANLLACDLCVWWF